MPGSLRLFKIAGIRIEVNVSWLVIVVLLTSSLALDWYPAMAPRQSPFAYWALGLLAVLLLFASVLVHELSHSLVAKARGLPVKSITLFIFGGVSNIEREPQRPGIEFQMAFVGPLTSLVIGGATLGGLLLAGDVNPLVGATLWYLGMANVMLGGFNLIPGFPLDGGRVLRSIIWKATGSLRTATRWAARVGQGVALLLILGGVILFFNNDVVNGLWLGFIGWFLLQAAQAENTQVMLEALFKGVSVGQLMSRPLPAGVPGDISLQQAVDAYVLPYGARAIPLVRDDILIGLLTLDDIGRVPRERWPWVAAYEAMTPLARLQLARPGESVNAVLPRLVGRDVLQLPVVDEAGRLVGMLSRDAIARYIEIRRGLGMESPPGAASPGEVSASAPEPQGVREPVAR